MVKQNKMEMLNINGGGIILALGRMTYIFGRVLYRSFFRW